MSGSALKWVSSCLSSSFHFSSTFLDPSSGVIHSRNERKDIFYLGSLFPGHRPPWLPPGQVWQPGHCGDGFRTGDLGKQGRKGRKIKGPPTTAGSGWRAFNFPSFSSLLPKVTCAETIPTMSWLPNLSGRKSRWSMPWKEWAKIKNVFSFISRMNDTRRGIKKGGAKVKRRWEAGGDSLQSTSWHAAGPSADPSSHWGV